MSETIRERAGGEPAGSSIRSLISTLVSPRDAFAGLAQRPVFGLALAVLVLAGVAAIYVSMSKVTAEDLLATIEASGRSLPDEARANPERILSITRWSQVATAAILPGLLYAVLAGIFLGVFRLLGSELTYRQSLATTVHGLLPLGVAALLGGVVAMGRETISLQEMKWGGILATHLGVLAGEDTGEVARALLTSIDLFSAWCVALLAIGFQVVARVSRNAAWATVLAIWSLGIGLKLAIAAFS